MQATMSVHDTISEALHGRVTPTKITVSARGRETWYLVDPDGEDGVRDIVQHVAGVLGCPIDELRIATAESL